MQATLYDRSVWDLFVTDGEVVEVRAFMAEGRFKSVVAGYFDDHDAFSREVRSLDAKHHEGIYFTLQVIDPRLIARAFNRMRAGIATTADNNVLVYRWLPIDVDPVRPAGIGSSDRELAEAIALRDQIADALPEYGLPEPIRAYSGNGGHLLVRLPDLRVSCGSKNMVRNMIMTLDARFSTDRVKVDTAVYNPARIWKLYGTTARKGDAVPAGPRREARPHRTSYIDRIGA